jgi:hypothetical protein
VLPITSSPSGSGPLSFVDVELDSAMSDGTWIQASSATLFKVFKPSATTTGSAPASASIDALSADLVGVIAPVEDTSDLGAPPQYVWSREYELQRRAAADAAGLYLLALPDDVDNNPPPSFAFPQTSNASAVIYARVPSRIRLRRRLAQKDPVRQPSAITVTLASSAAST